MSLVEETQQFCLLHCIYPESVEFSPHTVFKVQFHSNVQYICRPNGLFRAGHPTHLSHAFLPSYMHYARLGLMF